ncbi:MAG TPA: tRNA guanosine(15) transglycosylase TgtA [Methanomassiliicoccales archaeon]|nr:tRNA guanosine(15) transglycosylase TgtA [Methanomassiliicoccales archaeon]
MLEILERDGYARLCEFTTPSGVLETPALLPVINPKLMTVPPAELLERFGFKGIITNSYIIRKDASLRERALKEGLHEMLRFPGTIMTDSGTFQSHMYGDVEVSNEEIVSFQRDIGSDIGTVLDIFTEPDWGKERTRQAVDETLARTEVAARIKGKMLLAGVVQGSVYQDLREDCARRLSQTAADFFPIGGVVPLMETYRFADLVDVIMASKKGLSPERPVHLFGAGHPMVFPLAILLGCDFFDSSSYAKFARDDRMMMPSGTKSLADMKGLECDCPYCSPHTIESLRELPDEERLNVLARHNLHVSKREIERAKTALREGDLWELVETRCREHPALLDALRRIGNYKETLERFEPLSRNGAMFYTGPETLNRPSMFRYEKRYFERYQQPPGRVLVGFEEADKPYSRVYEKEMTEIRTRGEAHFLVMSAFGPVPMELDEIYPVAQSLFPRSRDLETEARIRDLMERFSHCQEYGMCLLYDGRETIEMLSALADRPSGTDTDLERVQAVSDYQFGKGASELLLSGRVEITKSKNTGKIRNVHVDGEHVLSMRAPDGFFSLKPAGAEKLRRGFAPPRMRVTVHPDAAPFNREGKNVFCGFILGADPEIVPGDEVLVVDPEDNLVAVGRALLVRDEMLAMKKGLAVKVRDGIKL